MKQKNYFYEVISNKAYGVDYMFPKKGMPLDETQYPDENLLTCKVNVMERQTNFSTSAVLYMYGWYMMVYLHMMVEINAKKWEITVTISSVHQVYTYVTSLNSPKNQMRQVL